MDRPRAELSGAAQLQCALIALTLVMAPLAARAQPLPDPAPEVSPAAAAAVTPPNQRAERERLLHQATFRRNLGIGLAVPGIALTVAGILTFVGGAVTGDIDTSNVHTNGITIVVGSPLLAVGVALLVPGGILWGIGQQDMDRYR
jgi:hypothetical protein